MGLASCGSIGSLIVNSLWLIAVDPHRGGFILLRPLEKALTLLDETLLPATSNAVERGNRRYRKMQKQVYRVRTQAQIHARLALDMWREAQAEGRHQTLASLRLARAG